MIALHPRIAGLAILALSAALAVSSTPAQAANDAATVDAALAPTLEAIQVGDSKAYYQTFNRYSWDRGLFPKPGTGDTYIILGPSKFKSGDARPYQYSYIYYNTYDEIGRAHV